MSYHEMLWFSFIDTVLLSQDKETYRKTKKQLEIIHRNGIIHGDIREDNILCTKKGKVYIIDFAYSIGEHQANENFNKEIDLASLKNEFWQLRRTNLLKV